MEPRFGIHSTRDTFSYLALLWANIHPLYGVLRDNLSQAKFDGQNCLARSLFMQHNATKTRPSLVYNNYSPKAKEILSNNEVEGIIRQYSLSLRGIIVLV